MAALIVIKSKFCSFKHPAMRTVVINQDLLLELLAQSFLMHRFIVIARRPNRTAGEAICCYAA
jgi:hypothetical protein